MDTPRTDEFVQRAWKEGMTAGEGYVAALGLCRTLENECDVLHSALMTLKEACQDIPGWIAGEPEASFASRLIAWAMNNHVAIGNAVDKAKGE